MPDPFWCLLGRKPPFIHVSAALPVMSEVDGVSRYEYDIVLRVPGSRANPRTGNAPRRNQVYDEKKWKWDVW